MKAFEFTMKNGLEDIATLLLEYTNSNCGSEILQSYILVTIVYNRADILDWILDIRRASL